MSRSQRLFDLLQLLRCHKYPVTAESLAYELNVSIRTIYRDIVTLQGQGADIEGGVGLGYVLKPTFSLPPMMFTMEELEALKLGAQWVVKQANGEFSHAAQNAMAKISAVLPSDHQAKNNNDVVRVASIIEVPSTTMVLSDVKKAIMQQRKVDITYTDAKQQVSKRVIWPMVVGFFQTHHVVVAWCETKQAFRHFRLDRMQQWQPLEQKYQESRIDLIKAWEKQEGISEQVIRY